MKIKTLASGSLGNCYQISDGRTSLLIECGIPITKIKQGLDYRLSETAACLVSHSHGDHSKAWKDISKAGINLIMSKGTCDELGAQGHRIIIREKHHDQYPKHIEVGTFVIQPFDVEHDCAEPLGFLIYSRATGEKLLYATDTFYIRYTFQGLTHIMIECNYIDEILKQNILSGRVDPNRYVRIRKSHMSLEHLKGFLTANDLSKLQEIYILHLSAANSDEARIKREIAEITGKQVYICT